MIKKIGGYYLNMPIKEMFDLRDLTLEEYRMFESVGIKRIFRDEKIYHGKDINFMGAVWNTIIGATEGRVYKISLQNTNADKSESDQIFKSAYEYLFKEMGKYSEYNPSTKRYIWDTPEGNVILDQAFNVGEYCIQLFLTSSLIKQQATEKYEQLHEAYKTSEQAYKAFKTSTYFIGYGKITFSFWVIVIGFIIIWFNFKIGLLLLILGLIFFIWATLQKKRHSNLLKDILAKQYKNKQDKELKNE